MDEKIVNIPPPTPIQVLAGLLENAEYDKEKDIYVIKLSGDLYRIWTNKGE